MMMETLERELRLRLVELRQHHAAAACGFPDKEAAAEQFEKAQEDWYEVGRRSLPYLRWPEAAPGKLEKADPKELKALWENAFGVKINGPEVQAYANARMTVPKTPSRANLVTPRVKR